MEKMLPGSAASSAPLESISPEVAVVATVSTASELKRSGAASWMPKRMAPDNAAHITNCVNPTKAIPTILPTSSWAGFTDESSTSTIRFDFSSNTPRKTKLANMMIMK